MYKYILYSTVCPLWCKLYNYENTQSDLPSAEAGKYRGRILGQNPAKSLTIFPPCYSQSPLQLCLRFLLLQITQPLTISVKAKGGKPDRKPFPPSLWFKKSIQIPHVRELSRLCPETSTWLYVHEFGFCICHRKSRGTGQVVFALELFPVDNFFAVWVLLYTKETSSTVVQCTC